MAELYLRIIPCGTSAYIEGEVPDELNQYLEETLFWMSVEDLGNIVRFYTAEGQVMFSGSMHKVKRVIEEWCARRKINLNIAIDFPELEKQYDWVYTPPDYGYVNEEQNRLQAEATAVILRDRVCAYTAPPGFGKSATFCKIIADIGLPAIVIVEADDPFEQAVEELERCVSLCGIPVKVGRGKGAKYTLGPITVITKQTWDAARRKGYDKLLDHVSEAKVVIIDEAHNAVNYLEILDSIRNPQYVVAVSATYFNEDGREGLLYGRFGEVHWECSYQQAISAGINAPCAVYVDRIPRRNFNYMGNLERAEWKNQDFRRVKQEYIFNNEERHNRIFEFVDWAWESENATCAIICDKTEHIDSLRKLRPSLIEVTGTTKKDARKEIWRALNNREITCVVSTLLDEAVNIRSLGAISLAAGGKSLIKLTQRLRNLRMFKGMTHTGYYEKKIGLIHYPYDQCDWLEHHSKKCYTCIEGIVAEHPSNVLFNING